MSTNKWKDIEVKLNNWNSLDDIPPFAEIEILRLLDEMEQADLSEEAKALLYCMLILYRLKRNVTDDHLQKELEAVKQRSNHPMITEVQSLNHYLSTYNELAAMDLNQYQLRETDFNPVKLKKVKALLQEMNRLQQWKLKQQVAVSNIRKAYNQLFSQIEIIEEIAEDMAFALEQRKSIKEIQLYNEAIDRLNHFLHLFYDALPDFIKEKVTNDPLEELNQMIGLGEVKQYINQYYHYLRYQQKRKEAGFQMSDEQGLNMVITGNPGTGKTTIARLLATIYHRLGILKSDQVIEVNRSQLVGSFMGQSEENTLNYVKKALGGVLFIDEAYNLKREDQTGNDYGQAVIDTLVSSMTSKEYANQFVVFLAGYPEEMEHFLWANQGLRSRFPEGNVIKLPDFNDHQLLQIAEETALQNDYFFTEKAKNRFLSLIEKARVDDSFGNARTVRDLVLRVIFHIGSKQNKPFDSHWIEHMKITEEVIASLDDQQGAADPMKELEQLIGLKHVKEEVKKLSSFVQIQQKRKALNLPMVPIQLHSVFSGNPGTGKTTVAKLFAQILKQCGLLKRGHLVIASRSDLVAGYVGQTAMKTKNKIREALGGVLFIDEAYALYRGEKDFGKEAIDTLVDEMTKHNENLVVILAGYKEEMERFITSNPGLESRFKKYFHFEDYSEEELLEMVQYHVNAYQYKLEKDVEPFLTDHFSGISVSGNGRFIVNLINEAIQYQALRLEMDTEDREPLEWLNKKDFELAFQSIRGTK
ncbi:AAA family ATPase [Gracilibacillus alcaliphilus]|uniref:AAA family ATPase n=1 Tax=Gracilibacillus alcaliphilus TaxID=1401441 RepID=UPI00195D15E6|nr:AAA family ATPase [Gracilibacillus alcaliphilus]MBM7676665.1 SpoVK/Ycf46/Vps4 family AAA+-type ATPase [Gracilibacillus alcaliphilus]